MNQIDFTKLKPAEYCRKSSESEDKQVLSISSQHDANQNSANYYNLQKFVDIFQESKSAKTEFARPEFTRMMNAIEKGLIDCIVCWKPDRLARNMTEGGKIIDLLSSGRLKAIISHDKVFYPWDNVIVLSVEFSQGKQFVKELSINVKRGQTKKASMGIPHGVASLGFLNDKTEEKGNRKWLVDKTRINKIQNLLEMFLTGTYSAGKLHKYATEALKLTTLKRKRIEGSLIPKSRIYEILKDPIYSGFFYYDGLRYGLDNSLPRLITEDQHIRIKNILSRKNVPKTQKHETAYSGFIKSKDGNYMGQDVKHQVICDCKHKFSYLNKSHCPSCSKNISTLNNPKYLAFTYYYDVKKKKSQAKYKSLPESKVTKELIDYIDQNFKFSDELVEWSKKYITEIKDKELSDEILKSQIAMETTRNFELKKARLRAMLRDEQITPEEYATDMTALSKQHTAIDVPTGNIDWYARINEIISLTQCTKEVLEKGDIQARRNILSRLGSNLVWDDKNLFIYNDKAINKLIEGIKMAKQVSKEFEPKNYIVNNGSKEKTEPKDPVFSILLRG